MDQPRTNLRMTASGPVVRTCSRLNWLMSVNFLVNYGPRTLYWIAKLRGLARIGGLVEPIDDAIGLTWRWACKTRQCHSWECLL
jgi:hypothetical protein